MYCIIRVMILFSGGDPDRAIQEGAGKPSLQTCHRLCQTSFGSRGEHVPKVFQIWEMVQKNVTARAIGKVQ